jgi:ATP-binding cassette, subfamily B, multidrug efflux pump
MSLNPLLKILPFIKPYRKRAILALILLTSLVFMDLAIPRLIQRIIDQGIARNDQAVVIQTALIMIGISALSTLIAIGNNYYSIQVGAWRATCATHFSVRSRPFPSAISTAKRPAN